LRDRWRLTETSSAASVTVWQSSWQKWLEHASRRPHGRPHDFDTTSLHRTKLVYHKHTCIHPPRQCYTRLDTVTWNKTPGNNRSRDFIGDALPSANQACQITTTTVSVKWLFFQVSRFPLRYFSCTSSRKELLEVTGTGFLTGWCAFYQPINQPSVWKHWREHKALTLTSGLDSSCLYPPLESW